jgi:hypothetical protein
MIAETVSIAGLPSNSSGHPVPSPKSVTSRRILQLLENVLYYNANIMITQVILGDLHRSEILSPLEVAVHQCNGSLVM